MWLRCTRRTVTQTRARGQLFGDRTVRRPRCAPSASTQHGGQQNERVPVVAAPRVINHVQRPCQRRSHLDDRVNPLGSGPPPRGRRGRQTSRRKKAQPPLVRTPHRIRRPPVKLSRMAMRGQANAGMRGSVAGRSQTCFSLTVQLQNSAATDARSVSMAIWLSVGCRGRVSNTPTVPCDARRR